MLTEFGGIAYSAEEGTWGYSRALRVVRSLPVLAGFCYTQFADTYQEANGFLFADRRGVGLDPRISLRNLQCEVCQAIGERRVDQRRVRRPASVMHQPDDRPDAMFAQA